MSQYGGIIVRSVHQSSRTVVSVCDDNYYGPRCDILCMEGTENIELGCAPCGKEMITTMQQTMVLHERLKCAVSSQPCVNTVKYPVKIVHGQCNLDNGECDCFDGYTGELCELMCSTMGGLNCV